MREKLPKKIYRWQPEIATSLIYWSLTFTIFFVALIVQLELIKFNFYSIGLGILFIYFVWYGLQRKLGIKDDRLVIQALRKKNSRIIPISSIVELSVGTMGLTIIQDLTEETILMSENNKVALISEISEHHAFVGKIKGI